MVERFNAKLASGETHPVRLATDLMYDFVTIHPFSNGNGRMCRMVFTYALHRCGFPLLVVYSSPHPGQSARKAYLRGIIKAQTSLSVFARYPMYSMAFYSVGAAVRNAETYFMGTDSDEWSRLTRATAALLRDQYPELDIEHDHEYDHDFDEEVSSDDAE
jgi:hypothetical protein